MPTRPRYGVVIATVLCCGSLFSLAGGYVLNSGCFLKEDHTRATFAPSGQIVHEELSRAMSSSPASVEPPKGMPTRPIPAAAGESEGSYHPPDGWWREPRIQAALRTAAQVFDFDYDKLEYMEDRSDKLMTFANSRLSPGTASAVTTDNKKVTVDLVSGTVFFFDDFERGHERVSKTAKLEERISEKSAVEIVRNAIRALGLPTDSENGLSLDFENATVTFVGGGEAPGLLGDAIWAVNVPWSYSGHLYARGVSMEVLACSGTIRNMLYMKETIPQSTEVRLTQDEAVRIARDFSKAPAAKPRIARLRIVHSSNYWNVPRDPAQPYVQQTQARLAWHILLELPGSVTGSTEGVRPVMVDAATGEILAGPH